MLIVVRISATGIQKHGLFNRNAQINRSAAGHRNNKRIKTEDTCLLHETNPNLSYISEETIRLN